LKSLRAVPLIVLGAASLGAQVSADVALSNGVQLSIAARDAQGQPVALQASLEPATGDSFYRIFRDENNLAVYAYRLQVARTTDGRQFRVTALPATNDFAARFPDADGGKPTPTFSAPLVSPLLDSGGSFVIPISSNPGLNQTITDRVQVRLNERGATIAPKNPERQQLIRFDSLKVSIDNRPASPPGAGAVVAGRVAMFYIPRHGGYFFATEPVAGRTFTQIGIVDGEHLRFTLENQMYDCTSEAPILTNAARGQLWVYHDASYQPAGNWTNSDPRSTRPEFFTAASDSAKWWLP